ncbi:MAG: hypothetical protein I8H69_18230, partial [Burkholderiales bacterium]|nr:hypothetical protein [Burkholderiales bacterium]
MLMPLTLLATQGSKRVRLMQAARAQLRLPPAQVLEWRDWLAQQVLLEHALRQPGMLKIEPPGDDPAAHLLLLQAGCRRQDPAPVPAP